MARKSKEEETVREYSLDADCHIVSFLLCSKFKLWLRLAMLAGSMKCGIRYSNFKRLACEKEVIAK